MFLILPWFAKVSFYRNNCIQNKSYNSMYSAKMSIEHDSILVEWSFISRISSEFVYGSTIWFWDEFRCWTTTISSKSRKDHRLSQKKKKDDASRGCTFPTFMMIGLHFDGMSQTRVNTGISKKFNSKSKFWYNQYGNKYEYRNWKMMKFWQVVQLHQT